MEPSRLRRRWAGNCRAFQDRPACRQRQAPPERPVFLALRVFLERPVSRRRPTRPPPASIRLHPASHPRQMHRASRALRASPIRRRQMVSQTTTMTARISPTHRPTVQRPTGRRLDRRREARLLVCPLALAVRPGHRPAGGRRLSPRRSRMASGTTSRTRSRSRPSTRTTRRLRKSRAPVRRRYLVLTGAVILSAAKDLPDLTREFVRSFAALRMTWVRQEADGQRP